MSRIYCLVIALLCVVDASAQKPIDTSYKTTYYEQKVTMYGLLPHPKRSIVFLGDSITDIAEWSEIWQNNKVKNRGISSDNTFGVLARLDDVIAFVPEKIFIMIGINDIARDTPDSMIIGNHEKICRRLKAALPKTKIFIESLLPTNNNFSEFHRHQNKMEHIRFVNDALKQLCKKYDLTYVDLYSQFLDSSGKLSKQYTNDGLHINGYGYALWKKILLKKGYMN
jgi:lysophospholipase L1-like esterase